MRARTMVFTVVIVAIGVLLITDPQTVIGSLAVAAFALVLWQMLAARGGLLRRGGRR